jgi:hypothetical protein
MNKGVVAFAVFLMALMGMFFVTYFRDKASPPKPPRPIPRERVVELEPKPQKPAPVAEPKPEPPAPPPEPPRPVEPPAPVVEPPPAEPVAETDTIEGAVCRKDTGEPVRRFEVRFVLRAGRGASSDAAFTLVENEEGRFQIPDVPAGKSGSVEVRAQGFALASQPVADTVVGLERKPLKLLLEPAAAVVGIVRNSQGEPVADVRVTFRVASSGEALRTKHPVVQTDKEGAFRHETSSNDPLKLDFYHSDYAPLTLTVTPEVGRDVECNAVLGKGGSVQGRVWMGREPLPGQPVTFTPQFDDIGSPISTKTGPDGSYKLAQLPVCDGTVEVTLTEAGNRTKKWNGYIEEGQVEMVDFEFAGANASVYGQVTMSGEAPKRATLSLLVLTEAGEEGRTANADELGYYRFDSVPLGPVSLTIDAENSEGKLGFDESRFELQDGESRNVNFKLEPLDVGALNEQAEDLTSEK